MKVFTRDYRIDHFSSPLYDEYFAGLKSCVLDIEATGLSPANSKVMLVGLLTATDSGVRITQFLSENHYEEDKVLAASIDFLKDEKIDYLITFNGLSYDLPFINTRLERLFMSERIKMYNFDLYRFLRKCTLLPDKLDSLSQMSCEKYFGIASDRRDIITGRENIQLFEKYALNGDSTIEKIILTHNREDVYQLYRLLSLAGKDDFAALLPACAPSSIETSVNLEAAGMSYHPFHTAIARYGFPAAGARFSVRPQLGAKQLKICGDQIHDSFAAAYFPDLDSSVTACFNASTSSFDLSLPVARHENSCFVDLNTTDIELVDEDVVNDFLILNPRTVNLLSARLVESYL